MAQQDDPPGAIVNISSGAAFRTGNSGGHYNVSKAAVTMLTKQMARELAEHGIRVNEVCPGLVVTDMNREDVKDPDFRKSRLSSIPLGKFGQPEDVADAVAFLLSDSAKHTTGTSLRVDGGSTL
jgi:L-rhamnose 1-dehydrogenase